jgi:hypothetical protein
MQINIPHPFEELDKAAAEAREAIKKRLEDEKKRLVSQKCN